MKLTPKIIEMRNQGQSYSQIAKHLGCAKSTVAKSFMTVGESVPNQDLPTIRGGIKLSGKQVFTKRPATLWPARFRSLKLGYGYPVRHLSELWGVTEETLRKRSKALKCLRYVEGDNGDYIPCIVNPKTIVNGNE